MSRYEVQSIDHYTEYRYAPEKEDEVDPTTQAQLITTASVPTNANRYLVTLIHKVTEEEALLDILIDGDRFVELTKEIRQHYDYNWEIFEWFNPDAPF